jgi:hypothetical protein
VLSLETAQLHLVSDAELAKMPWDKIRQQHDKNTIVSKVQVLKKLCTLHLSDTGDMEAHLVAMENLLARVMSLEWNMPVYHDLEVLLFLVDYSFLLL